MFPPICSYKYYKIKYGNNYKYYKADSDLEQPQVAKYLNVDEKQLKKTTKKEYEEAINSA